MLGISLRSRALQIVLRKKKEVHFKISCVLFCLIKKVRKKSRTNDRSHTKCYTASRLFRPYPRLRNHDRSARIFLDALSTRWRPRFIQQEREQMPAELFFRWNAHRIHLLTAVFGTEVKKDFLIKQKDYRLKK